MSTPQLTRQAADHITITGPLSFTTAGPLLELSDGMFAGQPRLEIDLSQVSDVDSAALALLIEWLRQARQHECTIYFKAVPQKLLAIARLSGVEDIIGAARQGPSRAD